MSTASGGRGITGGVEGAEAEGGVQEGDAASRFALRSRPFRRYMFASFVSWVGDWMDLATLNWVVLTLTDSPLALGLINACRLLPVFALSLPGGVLADRYDRRRLLQVLQAGMMVLTFALGGLLVLGTPFWLFALVVALRSVLAAMATPVRHSLLSNLVPPVAVASAVAVQTAVLNFARIAGPAAAGLLLAVLAAEQLFWINGASFAVALATLFLVEPRARAAAPHAAGATPVREALHYLRDNPSIQSLLVLALAPIVFGFPYATMMPLFARDLLGLGPAGFGALLSLAAAGALLGSVWLSAVIIRRVGQWLVVSTIAFGVALLLFILSGTFWLAACMMVLVGLASQVYRTTSRIALQVQVPDRLRGRILSIVMMDRGLIPLGAVLLGGLAEWAGAFWAGVAMGSGCVAVTLLLLLARRQLWSLELTAAEDEEPAP